MRKTLVLAEIEADGERCGPCRFRRPLAGRWACRLFGGIASGGLRTEECREAELGGQQDPPAARDTLRAAVPPPIVGERGHFEW